MDPDSLAETVGTLNVRNIKDTGLESSPALDINPPPAFSSLGPSSRMSTGDRKELNARDYFDETNTSYNQNKRENTPQNTTASDRTAHANSQKDSVSPQGSFHYIDDTPLPVKSRFVRSNGSPYGNDVAGDNQLHETSMRFAPHDNDASNSTLSAIPTGGSGINSPVDSLGNSPAAPGIGGSVALGMKSPTGINSPIRPGMSHVGQEMNYHKSSSVTRSRNSSVGSSVGSSAGGPAGDPGIISESESPFDHIDRLLPNSRSTGSPRAVSASASSSRPVSSSTVLPSHPSVPSSLLSFDGDSIVGVRQKEAHTRRLETENLELRLKLQQYREMNAGEQEITRIKKQVGRAEQRIDELEQALERKNETINQLIAERDAAAQQHENEHKDELFSVITELQASISELERANEESVKTDQMLFAKAHEEFPDIIPANAGVEDLVSAVRGVVEQNSTLTRVAGLASSLKVSHAQILGAVSEVGKKGDAATCIRELAAENNALRQSRQREHELMNLLQHSQETRRDLELVVMRLEESGKESKSLNYSIIRKFFAELFDVLGEAFQETVEAELQAIVEQSQGKATSKIPALSDLMVRYTRQIAEMANNTRASAEQERRILMLDGQVQSLEHLIELKMDKLGADSALRAQIRDLKRELKLVSEKRKSEWLEYQRALNKSQ